jgi:hypothetical protein
MSIIDIFKSSYRRKITETMKDKCVAFIEDMYSIVLPDAMLSNEDVECIEIACLGMFNVIASYIMAYGLTINVVKQITDFINVMKSISYDVCSKYYSKVILYSSISMNDLIETRLREYMGIHAAYVEKGIFQTMAVQHFLKYAFIDLVDLGKKNKFARLTIDQFINHWTNNSREFYYNKN